MRNDRRCPRTDADRRSPRICERRETASRPLSDASDGPGLRKAVHPSSSPTASGTQTETCASWRHPVTPCQREDATGWQVYQNNCYRQDTWQALCRRPKPPGPPRSVLEAFWLLSSARLLLIILFHLKFPLGSQYCRGQSSKVNAQCGRCLQAERRTGQISPVIAQVIRCRSFDNFYECLHARLQESTFSFDKMRHKIGQF